MKKIALCLIAMGLLLTFYPNQSNTATAVEPSSLVVSKPAESAREKALLLRLNEIKAMDKSNLTSSEKKELRIEVRSIQREYRDHHYGGYVSVGALIIIVLLLLILL